MENQKQLGLELSYEIGEEIFRIATLLTMNHHEMLYHSDSMKL